MNEQTLQNVSWIGDSYLEGEIKGVVLSFHGLGNTQTKEYPTTVELEWAKLGWLVVFPYSGPWSWMNKPNREFVDELVESVYEIFNLDENCPLISSGGSMGGHSALLYTRYAKKPVSSCIAIMPVCDLKYHFSERPDLPKTILYSFRGSEGDRETLFMENSPLEQAQNMPGIPYLFIHGDSDKSVNKGAHSDKMVKALKNAGHSVEYIEVPGMGHGTCRPISVDLKLIDYLKNFK